MRVRNWTNRNSRNSYCSLTTWSIIIANFGQDDTFAGNKTSGSAGSSDSSGNGKFYYTRISGAKALCSKSLGS